MNTWAKAFTSPISSSIKQAPCPTAFSNEERRSERIDSIGQPAFSLPIGFKVIRRPIALLLMTALLPLAVEAKEARCVIKQDGVTAYAGACDVRMEAGGSFSVRRHDGRPILPNITDISVFIVSPGVAEVRGLTTDGINSRWGTAVRSSVDRACWTGSDFDICAD